MAQIINAIRGMNDILPGDTPYWQSLEQTFQHLLASYGSEEVRLPIVEKTELFARSIGEVTDIVEKEMYTFEDRNGDSLTLRPEGTAGCVRAAIENGLLHNQTQRLWYAGPMFRHERPQKGRYRQFHQVGVEAFGFAGPDIDAELIFMSARLFEQLQLMDLELQINSLGTSESRARYRDVLVEYLNAHQDQLDDDSRRRLSTNPLRILDSKNPDMQALIEAAPKLHDYLDEESRDHFEGLKALLDAAGVSYRVNLRLVRGLDYYGKTVFEWVTDRLGAQGTVCAGGRYDGLVEQLGGKPVTAAGFAVGLERLIELVKDNLVLDHQPHVYFIVASDTAQIAALILSETLRAELPALRIVTHCGGGSMKSQFKRADKSGAALALVLGEAELQDKTIGIKFLREQREQLTLAQDAITDFLQNYINNR